MTITPAVLLSLVLATGAPLWDHPGYDAEDSHFNPKETAIHAGSIDRLTPTWSADLRTSDASCSGPSAPVLAGGRLFATDQLGIAGYTAADGRLQWRFDWDDRMDNETPVLAVSDDLLIAANGDCNSQSDPNGQLTALDVTSGKPRWTLPLDMPVNAVVVDKDTVVVSGSSPSDEDAVVAYRVRDGHLLWRRPNHATTGVSADGVLLLNKTDGFGVPVDEIAAVDIATGTSRWTSQAGWKARAASPNADRFYVTNALGSLGALDTATGALRWTANGKASELIAADSRRIYRADGRSIEALHADTGETIWTTRLTADAGQPVRAADLLYAGSKVLKAADGTPAGPTYPGHVVVAGGRLYQVDGSVVQAYE